jgi:NADPH-dependent curcumin reductase
MPQNMRILLKSTPVGPPGPEHFEAAHCDMPVATENQALVETLYLSLDPYMRGQISGRHLSGAVKPGDTMRGEAVSRVISSNMKGLKAGDLIAAHTGWQSHAVISDGVFRLLGFDALPPSLALGVLGMPGLTAYAGLKRLGEPKAGDRLLVSSAAGTVGATVGQIARLMGCETIGIAGGPQKYAWVTDTAKFAACIDYKNEKIRDGLMRLCPPRPPLGGVDIYFDNVGGDVLLAAMENMALHARVILCGLMTQYNTDSIPAGPPPGLIIRARATVRGMVVYDHEDMRAEAIDKIAAWIKSGDLVYREDMTIGLEHAGATFARLMRGETFGKVIVKVAN